MSRRLLGDAVINVILNGVVNVITYVLMVLAGRALSKPDYGLYQALLAVLTIGTVVSHSVQLSVTRETVLAAQSSPHAILSRWLRRASPPLLILLAVIVISSPIITPVIGGTLVDLAAGWSAFVVILGFSIVSGIIFGVGRPRTHAAASFAGSLFRLGGAILGAWAVFSVPVWILVYAVQFFVAALILLTALPENAVGSAPADPPRAGADFRSLATYVALAMPFFLDQLLVQIFSPGQSGDYAVLMLFAKIGYFSSVPLYAILFPHLVTAGRGGPWKGAAALAAAAVAMNALISLAVVGVAPYFIPHFFGANYSFSVGQMALGAAAIFLYPPAHLGVLAVLAFGAGSMSRYLAPVFLLQVCLFAAFQGAGMYEILYIQLVTMSALLVMTAFGVWRTLKTWKPAAQP